MGRSAKVHAQAASTSDLASALEDVLGRRVVQVARTPSAYHSSFPLEELKVVLADGAQLTMMFKDEAAPSLKPEFLYNPRREIEVYQIILRQASLGTPECYGAVADPRLGRYWLFLEKARGVECQLYRYSALDQIRRRFLPAVGYPRM